jgi:predicted ATPase/class 3 adenylate cyclase
MAVCGQCGTENPDIAKFCLACGSPIEAPAQPDEEERRPISAVFCDMVGSTSRGEELDPEDMLALLEPYYARLRGVLDQHGGTVEKFVGDAVVAVFGAPVAHEDDPERAVRAGLAIIDQIRELNEEDPSRDLRVRVGITTGEAIVALGPRSQERGLAWGDVLNTAARLQGSAPVNGIIVDERTHRASAKTIEFRELEPIVAKGKADPVAAWEVVGVKDTSHPTSTDVPLVGREQELETLRVALLGVRDRSKPALATVIGEPGMGKSRLVHETVERAEDATVLWGRCLSYGEGITYWPVAQMVRRAAGILGSDPGEEVAAKLDTLLHALPTTNVDELRTVAAALSNLLGAPTTPLGTFAADQISQAELHWGIRRTFELLAAEQPLVLVFEDLHWAEPTLLDLILHVLEAGAAIFVLCSARPELRESQPAFVVETDSRTVIELEPLPEEAGRVLVGSLISELGLDAAAVERLVANARGNPLFLEETARMLLDAGVTDQEQIEALSVPTSLQGVVGGRLDALPAPERRVTQHASVAGSVFWSGASAKLEEDKVDVDPLLEAVAQRDVLREHPTSTVAGEREWEFKHILLREVAYGRLPRKRRASLHVRFSDWIEELPSAADEFVEILAYHLEQACLIGHDVGFSDVEPPLDRAISALTRAAERAMQREGSHEARRYYERALALVPEDQEETRLELQLRRARILIVVGEFGEADEGLREVVERAQALGRFDLRCEALIFRANVAYIQGRGADATAAATEAETIASLLGDRRLQARAAYESAAILSYFQGEMTQTLDKLFQALALAEEEEDWRLQREGHLRLGVECLNAGQFARAEEHLVRCIELARQGGSLRDEARASFFLAAYVKYHCHGEVEEAEALLRQAMEWFERMSEGMFRVLALRHLALVALERRELEEAERLLQEALALVLERAPSEAADIYCVLVEVFVRQGKIAEARVLADLALSSVLEDDPEAQAKAWLTDALARAAAGEPYRMLEGYLESAARLAELQKWFQLAEGSRALAHVLADADRNAAVVELQRAEEACKHTDANALLGLIGRDLSELGAAAGHPAAG